MPTKKYARINNGVAIETFSPPAGASITDCFHPDLVSQFQEVPAFVETGYLVDEAENWTAPPPPEPAKED